MILKIEISPKEAKVRIPQVVKPPLIKLPHVRRGPLGLVEYVRKEPGELTLVSLKLLSEKEKGDILKVEKRGT